MVSPVNHIVKYIVVQILVFVVSCQSSAVNCLASPAQYIRVLILEDSKHFNLKISGSFEIIDANTKKTLYKGKNLNSSVTTFKNGILINGKEFNINKLLLAASRPEAVILNGRRFRGDIKFVKNNVKLTVINYIGREDYIKGILFHEASHYWPMEALKTQAIVCRTYAAYQMQVNKFKDYDITSDIYSQVYGGRTSERYRTNKAVEETSDLVLMFQDKVFPAYFHSTCAGHTEDAGLLWNINIASLKGVECVFCKDSPHFKWHYALGLESLEEKLTKVGFNVKGIKSIGILGKDDSGRITDLKIESETGGQKITAKDFRNIIGPNIIKSTNFKVDIINREAVFDGFGWGHGVGMCQWGAYFMAKKGYDYARILKYYYPQTNVKTIGF